MSESFVPLKACKSSTKLPREEQPDHFFPFPSYFNEGLEASGEKVRCVFALTDLNKGDNVGNRLRVGAFQPISAPFLPIIQGKNTTYEQGVSKLLHTLHHYCLLNQGRNKEWFNSMRTFDARARNL